MEGPSKGHLGILCGGGGTWGAPVCPLWWVEALGGRCRCPLGGPEGSPAPPGVLRPAQLRLHPRCQPVRERAAQGHGAEGDGAALLPVRPDHHVPHPRGPGHRCVQVCPGVLSAPGKVGHHWGWGSREPWGSWGGGTFLGGPGGGTWLETGTPGILGGGISLGMGVLGGPGGSGEVGLPSRGLASDPIRVCGWAGAFLGAVRREGGFGLGCP